MSRSVTPPLRFGLVETDSPSGPLNQDERLYRCAFPGERTFPFLASLGVKTLATILADEKYTRTPEFIALEEFCKASKIIHVVLIGKGATQRALELCVDVRRLPALLHCTDGVSLTSVVVAMLRRVQNWHPSSITEEFRRFTKKHREMDKNEREAVFDDFVECALPPASFVPYWLNQGEPIRFHPTLSVSGE